MPLYEYLCKPCGKVFERLRSYPQRHEAFCDCGLLVSYIPSAPARTSYQWGDTKWDGSHDRALNMTWRDKNHRDAVMKKRGLRELQPGEVEAEQKRVSNDHQQHERNMKTYSTTLKETGSQAVAMARTFPNPEV
jgi:putative FmdB family regulatory protein